MSYLNSIKQSFILCKKNILIATIAICSTFLIGETGSLCIVYLGKDVDDYASLGIAFALMAAVVVFAVIAATGFATELENAIKMGKTRKAAAVAILTNSLLNCYIVIAEIVVLGFIDKAFVNAVIKLPYEIDFLQMIMHPALLIAPIVIVALSASVGIAMQKWGKPVFWVLWAIWMFACLGGPSIGEKIANNDTSSLIGKIAVGVSNFIKAVPLNSFFLLAGILFIGLVIFLILNIRKYSIKN